MGAHRFDVRSADRTPLAVWADGQGPSLVLVHGSMCDHTASDPLVAELRDTMTTFAMDRRGFGASGDAAGYALEREFEDVAAVVEAVADRTGGPVALWGHSYGAGCALGGAALTGAVHRLVLYEPGLGIPYPAGSIEAVELLAGAESHAALKEATGRALAAIPGARVEVLDGHAHLAHRTDPAMVAAVVRGSSAAAGVEGVKGLRVAEAGVGADGRVPGADPALQVGVVADLAGVGGHGGQLGVDGGGHVDQLVGGVGAEQQHGVGAVGGEALGAQLRCVERVAGGDHAVDGEQPGGAVVGVEQPAPPGVVAEDHVGPHGPDQAGHGQAQGHGDLELAVDRPQEVDRGHRPQGGRGRGRLGPTHRGQLGRVGPRVGAALLPGGEAGQLHVDPPPRPGGQGAAALEVDVVRVGAERQRPPDGQH
jgi:hypothetical protein